MFKFIYLLFILLLAVGLIQAQSAFNLIGSGARASGMGGAFTGLADDATAISWNPAGLTQLQEMEASVVARLGFGSASYDFPGDLGIDSWDVETQSNFQFNFGSFVVPFDVGDRKVVAGLAYRTVFDFNDYQKGTVESQFGTFEYVSENTGGIYAISPAVAVPITDNFSVGATANIMSGSLELTEESDGIVDFETAIDFSGFSVDLGVLFRASDQFSAGASFNLPHTITWESEGEELDMKVPFFFSVGAAFKPSEVITVLFDYRGRSWSNTKFEVDGEEIEDFFEFENANSIHVGLEYLASSGDSFIPIRLGYNTVPLLFTDANDDAITGHNITGGVGFILGKLILDASIEYTILSYLDPDFTPIFGEDIDFSQNSFRITISGVIHLN